MGRLLANCAHSATSELVLRSRRRRYGYAIRVASEQLRADKVWLHRDALLLQNYPPVAFGTVTFFAAVTVTVAKAEGVGGGGNVSGVCSLHSSVFL